MRFIAQAVLTLLIGTPLAAQTPKVDSILAIHQAQIQRLDQKSQWKLAYEHDGNGVALNGSLALLKAAIENGSDVKVLQYFGNSLSVMYPVSVQIKDDLVTAIDTTGISLKGDGNFQDNPYHYWNTTSTNGIHFAMRMTVNKQEPRGNSSERVTKARWFVN